MSLSDFKNHKEALQVADDLLRQNQEELGHHEAPVPHENPLLVKCYYIHGEGKKRTWKQVESKKLEGDMDIKNKKQLLENNLFQEGLGLLGEAAESIATGVKIENLAWAQLQGSKESLKSACNNPTPQES